MPDKVRCFDCGYLGVEGGIGDVARASRSVREKCFVWNAQGVQEKAKFVCQKNKTKFSHAKRTEVHELLAVLQEGRLCEQWTEWHESKSPKEHEEMSLIAKLEARDATRDREVAKQRDEDVAWRTAVEKSIERRHNTTLIYQALLSLLAAIVALIGSKLLPWF